MLNKFYKTIHNKYSSVFNFLFYLRYLFLIFLTCSILFFSLPKFLDFEKRDENIKNYLIQNHNLELNKFISIKYNIFPVPNLEIKNVNYELSENFTFNSRYIYLYPKLKNLYNYKNFKTRKIKFRDTKLEIKEKKLNDLIKYIFKTGNKVNFDNFDVEIKNKKKPVLNIRNINYVNYGYKKNKFDGEIFKKKFNAEFKEDFSNIIFDIKDIGLFFEIDFVENINNLKGKAKAKIVDTNIKLNFSYDKSKLQISNLIFKNKNLLLNTDGILVLKPFFKASLDTTIKNINWKIVKNIKLDNLKNFRELIKKINLEKKVNFNSKKFSNDIISSLDINGNLAYGRMSLEKKFLISESIINCKSNINFTNQTPILISDCSISVLDKKKFLKKFSIKKKDIDTGFELNTISRYNIFKNEINFLKVEYENEYNASREDLIFFKKKFEETLLDEGPLNMINKDKIRKFIIEVS